MRFHRHQVDRVTRWHSVRVRHNDVWEWCAHQEEVSRHLERRRRSPELMRAAKGLKLQAAN